MRKLYEIEDDTLVFDCTEELIEEEVPVQKDDNVVELFKEPVV